MVAYRYPRIAMILRSDQPIGQVRAISHVDVRWALAEGWRDFAELRGDIPFVGVIYPLVCAMTALLTLKASLMPLFFPIVAGLSIAGPVVAAGFYELARRREEGHDPSWRHFLDPLRERSRVPLAVLTLGQCILFVLWLTAAWAIYRYAFGDEILSVRDFVGRLFTTREGWTLIILGNLAGAIFALITLACALVSFPMIVDRPVGAIAAVRTSIAAFRRNPGAILNWGAHVAGLLFLGLLPLAIGLAIVLPWLGYSTWHLYTRLVVR